MNNRWKIICQYCGKFIKNKDFEENRATRYQEYNQERAAHVNCRIRAIEKKLKVENG